MGLVNAAEHVTPEPVWNIVYYFPDGPAVEFADRYARDNFRTAWRLPTANQAVGTGVLIGEGALKRCRAWAAHSTRRAHDGCELDWLALYRAAQGAYIGEGIL